MPKQPLDFQRKNEHIFLSEKYYQKTNPFFEQIQLLPGGLPKVAVQDVDINFYWGNYRAKAPLYINAMTGGSPQTIAINKKLATVAAQLHLPMAVGSMSNYLKYPDNNEILKSYTVVREINPQGIIWANVSANTAWSDAQKCIDLLHANALQIHLNLPQEIVMTEGQISFNWLENIAQLVRHIHVPIIVKEVGFGISEITARALQQLGIKIIDLSGRGGTNFIKIENARNQQKDYKFLENWGLTTPQSLLETKSLQSKMTILASGGIRSPLDAVKCLVLGAQAVGIAAPILHSIEHQSIEHTVKWLDGWIQQMKELMVLLGCQKLQQLKQVDYRLSMELDNFLQQKPH